LTGDFAVCGARLGIGLLAACLLWRKQQAVQRVLLLARRALDAPDQIDGDSSRKHAAGAASAVMGFARDPFCVVLGQSKHVSQDLDHELLGVKWSLRMNTADASPAGATGAAMASALATPGLM
jgi:hypothetical protein